MDLQWKSDIDLVSNARILFGHQSVGWNIIEGMTEADVAAGGVKIVRTDSVNPRNVAYFAHSEIGRNGSPRTKCDAFLSEVDRLGGNSLQVAIMKFCFADFVPETDVDELVQYYTSSMIKLQSRYPRLRIVHVTAPLLRKTPLLKRLVKMVLGRPESSEVQNLNANRFNELLSKHFSGEFIFDLARLESTNPDGSRCIVGNGPDSTYTIAAEYTSDGGHLNELGRRRAAVELVRVLAAALRSNGPGM